MYGLKSWCVLMYRQVSSTLQARCRFGNRENTSRGCFGNPSSGVGGWGCDSLTFSISVCDWYYNSTVNLPVPAEPAKVRSPGLI